MFEYRVDDDGNWHHWSGYIDDYLYPHTGKPEYSGILVPNVDNVRLNMMIEKQGWIHGYPSRVLMGRSSAEEGH